MKRALTGVLTAALAVFLCTGTAFAAGHGCGRHFVVADGGICDSAGSWCAYVDADKNGICDICGGAHGSCPAGRGTAYVDADKNGICDVCGAAHGSCLAGTGAAYVDADRNGICDLCGGAHGSCLAGAGAAFVDADKNGVCDNCGTRHWCSMTGGCFVDTDGDGVCDQYQPSQSRGCGCRHGSQRVQGSGFHCGRGR